MLYKHILVPVLLDPDAPPTQALDVAKRLSDEGALVTLLHVMEEIPAYAKAYLSQAHLDQGRKEVLDMVKAMAEGIPGGKAEVMEGHSSRTILDYAEAKGCDCIIVSSHKPGVQDYFLGGTAARVVRYAQCAVHVVR